MLLHFDYQVFCDMEGELVLPIPMPAESPRNEVARILCKCLLAVMTDEVIKSLPREKRMEEYEKWMSFINEI